MNDKFASSVVEPETVKVFADIFYLGMFLSGARLSRS